MKYDDASWHYEGDFPQELPEKQGGVHMGMFLAWAIHNNLTSETHSNDWIEDLESVKKKELTGTSYLFKCCDGKLLESDLTEEGKLFADYYVKLPKTGTDQYMLDYEEILGS